MLAILDAVADWNVKLEAVATPPALSADLSLSGGLSVAVETMHGMDVSGGRVRGGVEAVGHGSGVGGGTVTGHHLGGAVTAVGLPASNSNETLSTCTTSLYTSDGAKRKWFHRGMGQRRQQQNQQQQQEQQERQQRRRRRRRRRILNHHNNIDLLTRKLFQFL